MKTDRLAATLRSAASAATRRAVFAGLGGAFAARSLPQPEASGRAKKRKKRCDCRPKCGGDQPFCCNRRCRAECCGDSQCATGEICLRGTCVVPCPTGTGCPASADTCCAGACVDTDTDPLNCGTCGTFCAPPATCASGSCAVG